ncbi:uncharacterized protein DDB_G0283697-like [Montipora capricornis]|uniref:uncharacterized protein DDB_G0283697-like n=1 Tax=Montipora capricornis TaxID=246305 RepID=UPI0035F1F14C
MFSYLAYERKKKEDGKTNVEEEKGRVKALKKQKDQTNNLKEKIVSELLKSQKNNEEEQHQEENTTDDLLKVLQLLERRSDECEKELDAHKRLFSIMISGGNNVVKEEEENEEKEEMRNVAQRKRNDVKLDILKDHSDKEKMEEEIVKLRAINNRMMQMLGMDQSEDDNKEDKRSDKNEKSSLSKKRRLEEEDTLDSLLEGLKKKGKKIKR